MRQPKETTYDAIKQGKMLGVNKFGYQLQIEDVSQYGPITSTSDTRVSDISANGYRGIHSMSMVTRRDGKILIAYGNVNDVILKVVDSEETIRTDPNFADGGTVFTTILNVDRVEDYCQYSSRINLLKLKNGKIQLYVLNTGTPGSVPWTVKLYESESGLGDDFILKSTPFSYQVPIANNEDVVNENSVGAIPYEADDGTLWLGHSYPYWEAFRIALYAVMCIRKSTDGGLTWSYVTSSSSNSPYTATPTFFIGNGGNLYCSEVYDSTQYLYYLVWVSEDNGLTWTRYSWRMYGGFDGSSGNPLLRFLHMFKDEHEQWYLLAGWGSESYPNVNSMNLYRYIGSEYLRTDVNHASNWEKIYENIPIYGGLNGTFLMRTLVANSGTINIVRVRDNAPTSSDKFYNFACIREPYTGPIKVTSIAISKGKGGANTATIILDNKDGSLNPRNRDSELFGILNLNKRVIIKQGYGTDLVESFTGIIDSIKMTTWPQVIEIQLRDNLKLALDQIVTKDGANTIAYSKQPIENIVSDLAGLAGLDIGFIQPTGISIEKEFSWQSYADALQFLADLASFEYLTDETGKFHFRRDYQPDDMYVAWSFEEGIDISNLSYEINDNDLYRGVRVYGKSGETVLQYQAPFLDAPEFNILPQKLLKVDATEASTTAELRKIAERAISTMRSRTRVIEFSSVAIPYLQIGDFIQLFESSTQSADVYRLTSMNITMDKNSFKMNCKAYYYGDSVVPIELPEDVAEQPTPNPNLNLIPEMTSNTTPSGVCRASSVYVLYSNDYKPWNAFNSTSSDLFWDASTNHGWIEYQFTEKVIVDKYMLKARQLTEYNLAMPRDWTFEAFDGEKWIVLDTRSGQTSWAVHEQRTFLFTNTTAYSKYRLNVSRNCGYKRLQLEQLAMYYGGGA